LAERGERRQHVAQAAVVAAAAVRLARLPIGVRRLAVQRAERQAEHSVRPSRRRRHACARRGCPGHWGDLSCARPASRGAAHGGQLPATHRRLTTHAAPEQVLRLPRRGPRGRAPESLGDWHTPQHARAARGAAADDMAARVFFEVGPRPRERGLRRWRLRGPAPSSQALCRRRGTHRRAARRRAATGSSARRGSRPPAAPAPRTAAPAAPAACAGGPRTRSAAPPAPARRPRRPRMRACGRPAEVHQALTS
jgi:hypothetical protein